MVGLFFHESENMSSDFLLVSMVEFYIFMYIKYKPGGLASELISITLEVAVSLFLTSLLYEIV